MLQLVACEEKYWEFVRNLRNDIKIQEGFIKKVHISPDEQINYMQKYASFYRICLFNNIPAGYIGVLNNDIRICTHPDFQKKGIGLFMVKRGMEIWPNAKAKIKASNIASLKLFKNAGFEPEFIIMKKVK